MPAQQDPSAGLDLILGELVRQLVLDEAKSKSGLNLAAYEGCLSRTARSLLGSPLAERYLLGLSYQRVDDSITSKLGDLSGMSLPGLSALERAAYVAASRMFDSEHVDFRPLSGIHATMCAVATLSDPGDLVLTVAPYFGGHTATRALLRAMGRDAEFIPWSAERYSPDVSATASLTRDKSVSLVLIDLGLTPFPLPVDELRRQLPESTRIAYDGSHNLGLIAGKQFPNPIVQGADVLFGNTHKSFPGPQKGLLCFADRELGERASSLIGEALISSQHTGDALALYLTILEMQTHAESYARQMVKNAQILADSLDALGFPLFRVQNKVTQSAAFWAFPPSDVGNHRACGVLAGGSIFSNARSIHGRQVLRFGTQYVTRQGMKAAQMMTIAEYIRDLLISKVSAREVRCDVESMASAFSKIHFSFDDVMNNLLCVTR